ncbi:unnamed protein product [Adineta steineri]|uniref:MULE transposase domain-containing protein n=1 Tax=Adineta steineri TaxID=433720 RepID=A0A815TZL5_9BILA|nr:unnamed protein product [Adineta steineri]CAF3941234.1 unnamed protein product [Adineta steineri]
MHISTSSTRSIKDGSTINELVPLSTSSKLASTKSSTCATHPAIQYEQKFSHITSKTHSPIVYPPSLLDSNIISPLATPQKEFSNLSIYSSIGNPPFDIPFAVTPTATSYDMNTTFIKQLSNGQDILSPSTSSLSLSETFLCQTPPKSSSSPILSRNNSSSSHSLTPSPQLTHSVDDDLSMNEDCTELPCFSSMLDTQYEAYLQGEIKFGESTKEKPMIFMSNYSYLYMSVASTLGTTGYRCDRKDLKCPTTIHLYTINNKFQRWNKKRHVHPPDPIDYRRRQINSTIKKRVANEHIPVCSIVEQEYAKSKLTKEEQAIFKTPKQLESGLLKSRRKMYPPLPTSQNFIIPDFISKTIDSTPFLLFDRTSDEFDGRLLVFSSPSQMDLLLEADVLMGDGTFRSCPRLFEQIYIILAVKDSKTYPVLFALTSNRKEATYTAILNVICAEAQQRGVSFAPHTFISDYERAWMNALITTLISGCWFHHVQSIYRWIQSNGLSKVYEEHEEKRAILRSFMALSLLPQDRVLEGFHIVKIRAKKYNELHRFVVYFERQWFRVFKPHLWCIGATVFRTNNSTESNNHRLNARIKQRHPNIWHFLVHLRTEEATISQKILKANLALIAPSHYQPTSKKRAEKKTMQIIHLHQLLEKKSRTLEDVIISLSYLVGSGKIKASNVKH